jgi:hypothetical protein
MDMGTAVYEYTHGYGHGKREGGWEITCRDTLLLLRIYCASMAFLPSL